jgi:hypothetical protein
MYNMDQCSKKYILKAFIIFLRRSRDTSKENLCVVHAESLRMRENKHQFTSTCRKGVSCLTIFVGPNMRKQGF